jgi:Zn-dependent protease with chaperone function
VLETFTGNRADFINHNHLKKENTMSSQEIIQLFLDILPLLIPIFLIQLGLILYALWDLLKRTQTRGPRWVWALFLILGAFTIPGGIIAAAIYLAWGRNVEALHDQN